MLRKILDSYNLLKGQFPEMTIENWLLTRTNMMQMFAVKGALAVILAGHLACAALLAS